MDESPNTDVIQGTLDMLILKALSLEPMHGFGVARRIEQTSRGVFKVNPGSLLVAFQRLERAGSIDAEWQTSDNGRRAKYYGSRARRPTAARGRDRELGAPRGGGRAAAAGGGLTCRSGGSSRGGIRVLARREAADDELDEELAHYLEQATEWHLERGLTPADARRAARRDVGSPVAAREQVRDHGWENVLGDPRRRRPLRRAHASQEPGVHAGDGDRHRPWAAARSPPSSAR